MTLIESTAILATANFSNVFLLVFQQQNVHHRYMALGSITSILLSLCQVAIIINSVTIGWASLWVLIPSGLIGFLLSMYSHPWIVRKMTLLQKATTIENQPPPPERKMQHRFFQ